MRVHPVFYVSLLKKIVGDYDEEALPEYLEGYVVDTFASSHSTFYSGGQWKGKLANETSWKEAINFKTQFPKVSLEKAKDSEGGSVSTDQIWPHVGSHKAIVWRIYYRTA